MKKYIGLIVVSLLVSSIVNASEVVISKGQFLHVPQSKAKRLIIRPGTPLQIKAIPPEDVYLGRLRVIPLEV